MYSNSQQKVKIFRFYDRFYVYVFRFLIVPHNTRSCASIVPTFIWMCAHQSCLHSRKCLIGRRDRTAIIAHCLCRVKEAFFWEVVSSGEAQWTLRGLMNLADIERRLPFLCLATCQVHFTQETRVIISNNRSDRLGFERGMKNRYRNNEDSLWTT